MRLLTYLTETLKLPVAAAAQPDIYVIAPKNIATLSGIRIDLEKGAHYVHQVGLDRIEIDLHDIPVSVAMVLHSMGVPILKVSGKNANGDYRVHYCVASNVKEEGLSIEEVAAKTIREKYGIAKEVIYEEVV